LEFDTSELRDDRDDEAADGIQAQWRDIDAFAASWYKEWWHPECQGRCQKRKQYRPTDRGKQLVLMLLTARCACAMLVVHV
jgi:hypothetical protein